MAEFVPHRGVMGLQTVDGTVKGAPTSQIYSWENKTALDDTRGKSGA